MITKQTVLAIGIVIVFVTAIFLLGLFIHIGINKILSKKDKNNG